MNDTLDDFYHNIRRAADDADRVAENRGKISWNDDVWDALGIPDLSTLRKNVSVGGILNPKLKFFAQSRPNAKPATFPQARALFVEFTDHTQDSLSLTYVTTVTQNLTMATSLHFVEACLQSTDVHQFRSPVENSTTFGFIQSGVEVLGHGWVRRSRRETSFNQPRSRLVHYTPIRGNLGKELQQKVGANPGLRYIPDFNDGFRGEFEGIVSATQNTDTGKTWTAFPQTCVVDNDASTLRQLTENFIERCLDDQFVFVAEKDFML